MSFLYTLESIRNPVLDKFFSYLTYFGDETLFIVVGLIFVWCIHKQAGRYLITTGLLGSIINQALKLIFRIPRPWVQDESLTIVEAARSGATGYSFPSGHTQNAVGVYGGVAAWTKNKALRIVCIVLAVLIPFSRLYLGVHTPLDVGVAALTALVLIAVLYPMMIGKRSSTASIRAALLICCATAVAYVLYVSLTAFPADMDADNLDHGIKNAWLLLGASLGIWVTFELDERYIHYETAAPLLAQLIKAGLGLALTLGLRVGLKAVLQPIFGGHHAAEAVRYFIMVLFAGAVWPLTFKRLNKIGAKG